MNSVAKISALVLAKNEAHNIERCLRSLSWVDEVIVVDNHSTDDTVLKAEAFSNVRVFACDWLGFSGNKKFGLSKASHDWIFWVDADEEVTPELHAEILRTLESSTKADAYDLPRVVNFVGDWVWHSGWYPSRVTRFFHREKAIFNDKILHEGVDLLPGSSLGHFQEHVLHFSYPNLSSFFAKMNQYGEPGAQELLRKGVGFRFVDLLLRPPLTFLKFFFLRRGYRDGMTGFIVSVGSAFSCFIRYANLYYLTRKKK